MRVVFIISGGGKSGLGHVVRSRLLADVFVEQHGAEVDFVLEKHGPGSESKLDGYLVYPAPDLQTFIHNAAWWLTMDTDVVIIDLEGGVPRWLVDHLRYVSSENPHKIISICGVGYEPSSSTWHLDETIVQGVPQYPLHNGAKAGLDWVIIDPAFTKVKSEGNGIYLSGGGTDVAGTIPWLLQAINMIQDELAIHLVVGPGFMHESDLQTEVDRSRHEVNIWRNADIPETLSMCNMGLVSYGMSVLECLAAGIPTLVVGISDAHMEAAQGLGGVIKLLGYAHKVDDTSVIQAMSDLMNDEEERQRMIQKGREMIDGRGVYRVADRIMEVVHGHYDS